MGRAASLAAVRPVVALLLLFLCAGHARRLQPVPCESEAQLVMCGLIPWSAVTERKSCCELYAAAVQPSSAAVVAAAAPPPHGTNSSSTNASSTPDPAALPPLPHRPDLIGSSSAEQVRALFSTARCAVRYERVHVPRFSAGDRSTDDINAHAQSVPLLSTTAVAAVKAAALERMRSDAALRPVWDDVAALAAGSSSSSSSAGAFRHPSGIAGGAGELALMRHRLRAGGQLQAVALDSLLKGTRVPPKTYEQPVNFTVPTDCSYDYPGPYAMPAVLTKYGGLNDAAAGSPCAPHYPLEAPQALCGHIGFVELDGQMAYKLALAWWATGDARYAAAAVRIVDGWSSTNKRWGHATENGPLEAAWGSASMSRALELLKPAQGAWPGLSSASLQQYVRWMNSTLLPQMDAWVAWKTPLPAWGHDGNMLANWHSSVAEAWLAYAIVANDRARYASAVRLYTATVHGYLKWGRGAFAAGRIIGETTETLRDVYHSLFGVGSLLQTAEMAWQAADDPSLYASGGHVLVAAMELHAAIVLAGANESALPHGYRLFESMPPPPDGCVWRIDLGRQRWRAVNASSGAFVSELEDGWKYVLGSKWLPTGWEIGYNHFAMRLGLALPQTAALLTQNWPEAYDLAWGLGSLTQADSASVLWQPGLEGATLCA